MSLPNELMAVGLLGTGVVDADVGYQIERSLRFNSADSAYLSRTPASAGNRKTWTWAGWVKRVTTSQAYEYILDAGVADNFGFTSNSVYLYAGSLALAFKSSTAVFRDCSAWMHYHLVFDSTDGTAEDRCRFYINGQRITSFSSNPTIPLNTQLNINNTVEHRIGNAAGYSFMSTYLADIHFIDGQALDPSDFGEFDATTGVWNPIAYSGTYGTNGFRLPFSDNSAATATTLGKDTSGNNNNWTPNNLAAGPTTTSNSWSGYFDGTGDNLTVTNNAAYDFGSGDFTIEAWAYPATASQLAFATRTQSQGFEGWIVSTTNFLATTSGSSWDVSITFSSALTANRWNHVAIVRNGNVYTAYLDGVANGTTTVSGGIVAGTAVAIIGQRSGQTDYSGYISNFRIVKGTAVYTAAFTPSTSPLTAITNTSLLTLQSSTLVDNSTNNFAITANGNMRVDFRSPFEESVDTDSLVDSPTSSGTDTGAGGVVVGNYCTWNPLANAAGALSNGNLDLGNSNPDTRCNSTISVSSGKWYYEVRLNTLGTNSSAGIGQNQITNAWPGNDALSYAFELDNARTAQNGSLVSYGSALAAGDIFMCAFDLDNGKIFFGKNGTWFNSSNPSTGTNPAFTLAAGSYCPIGRPFGGGSFSLNVGQRPFAYTAPSGFKALCTTNLPTPTILKGSDYFDTVLYTGTGASRSITGLSFSPDWVWIKSRSNGAYHHRLNDTVRGTTKEIYSNLANAEGTDPVGLTAFNSDGFTLGSSNEYNASSTTFVSWCWDAGTSTVTNTQGSITSTVRANASAGFSIVTYDGNSIAASTVGHGLGVTPSMIIVKRRNSSVGWYVSHIAYPNTSLLFLYNTSALATSEGTRLQRTNSTVFTVGDAADYGVTNQTGGTYVAYCFAPVAGYSAFGSTTLNASADGAFIYLGFRPKFFLIKGSSGGSNWIILDASRETFNFMDQELFANLSNAENTASSTYSFDFLSNGVKSRNQGLTGDFIYAAFAENPFSISRAR